MQINLPNEISDKVEGDKKRRRREIEQKCMSSQSIMPCHNIINMHSSLIAFR